MKPELMEGRVAVARASYTRTAMQLGLTERQAERLLDEIEAAVRRGELIVFKGKK